MSDGLIHQTVACFCFFEKAWKEALRENFFFRKISLRDDQGCFSFCGKHIRDGFGDTFSLVRKSNYKGDVFLLLFAACKK